MIISVEEDWFMPVTKVWDDGGVWAFDQVHVEPGDEAILPANLRIHWYDVVFMHERIHWPKTGVLWG